jgi:hypothetical protein
MMSRYRGALLIGAFALNVGLASLPASAALDLVVAQQTVVQNKPFSDCETRAKNALTTVMQDANEAGANSGEWVGVQKIDGSIAASAVIECHPDAGGYHTGFTCAVQVPPNPDTASALCTKLTTAFNAETAGVVSGGSTWH